MNLLLLLVLLALGWAAATGDVTLGSLLFGAVVAGAGLFVIRQFVSGPRAMSRLWRIVSLGWLFLRELAVSAFRVARLVLRPNLSAHLRPAIVAFPLTATRDAEITLLANLITLTPGTLSVDVSDDHKWLFVHALQMDDREAFIKELAEGFERKVLEAFR